MYEEELGFLNDYNMNILTAKLCDIPTSNGSVEPGVLLTVGQSPTFEGIEVVLTLKHISKILKLTKEYSRL